MNLSLSSFMPNICSILWDVLPFGEDDYEMELTVISRIDHERDTI